MTEEEFLARQTPEARAIYHCASELWDAGRGMVASFQVSTGEHTDVAVPAWSELSMRQRIIFADTSRQHLLAQIASAVVGVVLLVDP